MPQPSITDWLQVCIQLLTLTGVGIYTWLTYKLFKEYKAQNAAISEQLRLQHQELEDEREQRDLASLPKLEWANNFSGPVSSDLWYQNTLINTGCPVKNIAVEGPHASTEIEFKPSDYLDTKGMSSLKMRLSQEEANRTKPFVIVVRFTTLTGRKGRHEFEVKNHAKPRSLGARLE